MTTQTKPLFCPKCKGELKQSYSFDIYDVFKEIQGTIYFRVCFNCEAPDGFPTLWTKDKKLVKPTLEMDCLTEEQLKGECKFRPINLTELGAVEIYCETHKANCNPLSINKQTPSFCFAEGEDGNKQLSKLSKNEDTLINHDNNSINDDWINFSDRKPEVGKKTWLRRPINETEYLTWHIAYYDPIDPNPIDELATEWWQASQHVHDFAFSCTYNSDMVTKSEKCDIKPSAKNGRFANLPPYCFTHRAFNCTKGGDKQEKKECEHDLSTRKPSEYEKKLFNKVDDLDQRLTYIETKSEIKSQSQIAIDKVIEALHLLGNNMVIEARKTSSNWSAREEQIAFAFLALEDKLKELNK